MIELKQRVLRIFFRLQILYAIIFVEKICWFQKSPRFDLLKIYWKVFGILENGAKSEFKCAIAEQAVVVTLRKHILLIRVSNQLWS